MNYFRIFSVFFVIAMTTLASASPAEKKVELDSKIDSIWSQVGPLTPQANATIEVTENSGESATVIFQSLEALLPGGSVYFRVVLPNGKIKSMRGYITDGSPLSVTLQDGKFPENWPVGFAHFEAVLVSPQGAVVSYTSAYARVRLSSIGPRFTCCSMSGPLQSAYTRDGSAIDISGAFDVVIVASLNGQGVVPIPFGFSPWTGAPIHRIYTPNYGARESILTVCSRGVCSTRHIYFD